jgi:ParB-like chromosome segregation protein Spo0J
VTKKKTPKLKIQSMSVAVLSLDPANVREHNQRNMEAIRASLTRFGQQKPIVIDADGVIVAGNGTLGAAMALGWETIDVVCTDLNGADAIAYAIADNRTAELANWDEDALAQTLNGLSSEQSMAAGFDASELESLLARLAKDSDPGDPGEDSFDPEFLVLITCANEEEQNLAFETCQSNGFNVKLVS